MARQRQRLRGRSGALLLEQERVSPVPRRPWRPFFGEDFLMDHRPSDGVSCAAPGVFEVG